MKFLFKQKSSKLVTAFCFDKVLTICFDKISKPMHFRKISQASAILL